MIKIDNWEKVQASTTFTKLPAGGYVARITKVELVKEKNYLRIVYDIAEGPEKGRYSDDWGKAHEFAHSFIRSLRQDKETIKGMFKRFMLTVDATNGTNYTPLIDPKNGGFDEQQLVGKLIGIVLGEEEYDNDRGETKTRLYLAEVMTADDIRKGAYIVPDIRKAPERASEGLTAAPEVAFNNPINEDDLPF